MRFAVLPFAALVFACAGPAENGGENAAGNTAAGNSAATGMGPEEAPEAPADAPGENGSAPTAAPSAQPVGEGAQQAPEPAASVSLTASPESARTGGTVTLRLANDSRETIGYNLCTSALLAASGEAVKTDRICTMELRTLEPGRSATYAYELPATLEPGSYRFSTRIEWMRANRGTSVTSNAIRIAAR